MSLMTPAKLKIFACNANKPLAEQIVHHLGTHQLDVKLGRSEVTKFADGEISTRIDETVRGADVYIIQPTAPPVNDNLMELLVMIDAMKRASAGCINAVIPYFGYARQDRKARSRDPISAKLVADLITQAGADRVVTLDLHCAQIQGFFNIPVDHLKGMVLFAEYYAQKLSADSHHQINLSDVMSTPQEKDETGHYKVHFDDVCVVSPDLGSVSRARMLADKLDVPLAIVDKRRQKANESEVMNLIGNVAGKRCILLDDMIDTAGSICNAAAALKNNGATEVYAGCSHALFSGPAIERLENSVIEEVVILNTINLPKEKMFNKVKVLSVAPLFAKAIHKIHTNAALSSLFD